MGDSLSILIISEVLQEGQGAPGCVTATPAPARCPALRLFFFFFLYLALKCTRDFCNLFCDAGAGDFLSLPLTCGSVHP